MERKRMSSQETKAKTFAIVSILLAVFIVIVAIGMVTYKFAPGIFNVELRWNEGEFYHDTKIPPRTHHYGFSYCEECSEYF